MLNEEQDCTCPFSDEVVVCGDKVTIPCENCKFYSNKKEEK